ncbi:STAS/SEC14 domain-containing protein [Pontibacter sp. E15-1]|uniref:STAS/SEC14 domain-containing protein n=1 Tax=Pontibacter sp. E15-1 TaxID=2919918 RepID=UPI001F4FCFFB|nr:STAS/SEC14 domain-containing protein [Pontibacter sp. E15-1]MCJ8165117.1 STAS/SEC14 domain-containing protein [Pontibacter sp. E15-1]
MLQLLDTPTPDLVAFRVSGRIDENDYAILQPMFAQRIAEFGKIRVYAEMLDLEGITLQAIWEDLKMDVKYAPDISRAAMVGDSKWEEILVKAASPFLSGDLKYFDFDQREAAWKWVNDNF